jgi:hypothetical protein
MHCQSYCGCALECDCSSQVIALEYGLGLGKTTEKREWRFGREEGGGRIVLHVLMVRLMSKDTILAKSLSLRV